MKKIPPKTRKTSAELEAERKRRAAEWWNRVIVYYLNQMYHREVDRQVEKYRPKLLVEQLAEYYHEQQAMKLLKQKEPGKLSALEILQKMQAYQEEDSPFRDLYREIQENPEAEEKIEKSLSRCVEEAPAQILGRHRGRRNAVHIRRPHTGEEKVREEEPPQDPQEAEKEHERLRCELTFLRSVAPRHIYRNLCAGLMKQGRLKETDEDLLPPPPEEGEVTYGEYVTRHRALPAEKKGELGNLDELYTSAAYMLAAYEQKDEPLFSEKAADARAMQLSGSKAFRLYMKDHPGSLLAAAQNTGLEATHGDLTALDRELEAKDGALAAVRDALRAGASGQTAAYHKMMNGLDRFLNAQEEPSKKERDALALELARYVMTEGDPKHPNYCREGTLQAARALQVLLPEKEFQKFLETANEKRAPEERLSPEKPENLAAKPAEAAAAENPPVIRLERNIP